MSLVIKEYIPDLQIQTFIFYHITILVAGTCNQQDFYFASIYCIQGFISFPVFCLY